MVNFIWSKAAKDDYWNNIDYLLSEWTGKEASDFIEMVNRVLNVIRQKPRAFPKTDYKNIRAAVIAPQITLYYNIRNKNNIELIRFWNNHQDPQKLAL